MKEGTPLSDLTRQWLQECEGLIFPETVRNYTSLMQDHIIPGLGERVSFTQEEVSAFLDGKLASGMAESTVAMMERVLRRVLEFGHSLGQCEEPSWTIKMGTPRAKKGVVILTPLEERQLASYLVARPSDIHLCIFLQLTAGLTSGEVLGAQWKDVSIAKKSLRVHLARGTMKNRRNRTRSISLDERQLLYLRKLMVEDPEAYLCSGRQKPRVVSVLDIQLKKIAHELLLSPETTPKSLRHTYAVRCIERGMDYETLAKKLGIDNAGGFRRFYRELVSEEHKERLERERFESRKVRVPNTTRTPSEKDYEVELLERKIVEKRNQLKYELDNLEFDLDIIRTLRNSDCVQGKAREGLYKFVEKVLGPDDKDGQYLMEYMRYNMRVATMPLRVNNVTTVQAIRSRVSHGFEKLCKRLDEINAVEGWDILGMFKDLCARIEEVAPAAPPRKGRSPKPSVENDYKNALAAIERIKS